jgi:hypothetical protein
VIVLHHEDEQAKWETGGDIARCNAGYLTHRLQP